jgi:hypothetical protein
MLIHCPRVQAFFPREEICLEHLGPAWMLWAEHGGAMILRVGDLKLTEPAKDREEAGIFLEMDLTPPETLIHKIEGFAAKHNLILAKLPPPECSLTPILAACHIPEKNLFIFAEESELLARPTGRGAMEIAVRGSFKARPELSREADLVIRLAPPDLVLLLSFLLARVRAR